MTPAFALLLQAVRPRPDITVIRRQAALISDWDDVVARAREHAVEQMLLRGMHAAELPSPDVLKQAAGSKTRRSLRITGQLVRVAGALAEAGLPYLTFKGPTESLIAYRNPALRNFRDIDLIVAPADMARAIALLQSLGFAIMPANPPHYVPSPSQVALYHREARSLIDLHARWADIPGLFDWPFAEAFEQRHTVQIADTPIHTLPDVERLLFLCLHGGLHLWEKLSWVCDLAWEAATIAHDGEALERRARRLGVSRQLSLGMALGHRLLDMPLPPGFAETVLPFGLRRLQAEATWRLEHNLIQQPRHRIHALICQLLLRDSHGSRLAEILYRWQRLRQRA